MRFEDAAASCTIDEIAREATGHVNMFTYKINSAIMPILLIPFVPSMSIPPK
jgi:hypothetical protein